MNKINNTWGLCKEKLKGVLTKHSVIRVKPRNNV